MIAYGEVLLVLEECNDAVAEWGLHDKRSLAALARYRLVVLSYFNQLVAQSLGPFAEVFKKNEEPQKTVLEWRTGMPPFERACLFTDNYNYFVGWLIRNDAGFELRLKNADQTNQTSAWQWKRWALLPDLAWEEKAKLDELTGEV